LQDNGIEWVDYFGIQPNPLLSHAQAGASLAQKKKWMQSLQWGVEA
jgi:alcohol dehydrogenase YqhD (iron-dependent ADH family)